jgi:hypothetical protein
MLVYLFFFNLIKKYIVPLTFKLVFLELLFKSKKLTFNTSN